MQQSPDHTDDIRLIEGSMMVICLFKLQSSNDASSKFKRCLFTVGKQIAFSWWLPDSARPAQ
jgi:hypothetical protein